MKNKKTITLLVLFLAFGAVVATTEGIFSHEGPGPYSYTTIRGKEVIIYGKGLYKDMSAEVAPQGIAQDYVTLLIGIPLLLFSLWRARNGSIRGQYLLTGTVGYFLVTYLFYTVMGMYNKMFIVYVLLMGLSFYAFVTLLLTFDTKAVASRFKQTTPYTATGGFLLFNAISIALLWLSIVIPPLLNGTIIPAQVEHYTTLIVQALDLGILLPGAFLCGLLWIRKAPLGFLLTPVYFVFLSVLMTALTAKVLAMAMLGYPVIPVIFIIPTFNLVTIFCTVVILRNLTEPFIPQKIKPHEKATYA
jgi:hypothetical protein